MSKTVQELEGKAKEIRRLIIKMLTEAGSGHPGGSLSSADIVTALYFEIMRHNPKDPEWKDRDRFIFSKGHCVPAQYACLALTGYFPIEELWSLRKYGSRLQGHPDMLFTPGIEASTGSLGQGLSIACGIALAAKLDKKGFHTYVILGDGEIQEGQIWEAAMSAAHFKLDNLCAFIDYNKLQIDGLVKEIMNIEPLIDKWQSFGWETKEIDGHNILEILEAAKFAKETKKKPTVIIAHTIKGKGVSFMEGKVSYHGVAPTKEEEKMALAELQNSRYTIRIKGDSQDDRYLHSKDSFSL